MVNNTQGYSSFNHLGRLGLGVVSTLDCYGGNSQKIKYNKEVKK